MANKKADNQWYGKGFEQAIVKVKNNLSKENPYPEHIPALDWFKILKHAAIFISQYEERYGKIVTIAWIGNKTNSADGDLIINGEIIEVKYTESNGNAILGPNPLTSINFKNIFFSSISLKPYNVLSSSLIC